MLGSNQQKITFTSYVKCTKPLPIDPSSVIFDPKLLSGEIVSIFADVHMFPPTMKITDETEGIQGKLFVTNFKLSFIPYDPVNEQRSYQQNRYLRRNDVTLSNIDIIYQIVDKKKKRLLPQQKVNSKIDALYIICKNFLSLKFSFKVKSEGTLITSALAQFAFPSRHDLSFAFYYNDMYCDSSFKSNVTMFNSKNDWVCELRRCGATEWKVVSAESIEPTSMKASTLKSQPIIKPYIHPKFCVIPKCFNEKEFFVSTNAFWDSRSAFWVYSFGPTSASLVRMGELKSYREGRTIENVTLEKIRNCDPDKKSLEFKNLSEQFLPTIYEIRQSYLKLRELCTPDSLREFSMQDSKYCSLLDKSGWLNCVSACLKFSLKMSEFLRLGTTVVLQESNAREMCCVISSITQILLDPHFRTFNGFQSLIQKEWIAMDHPFCDRLGHTWKQENASTSSTSNSILVNNFMSSSNNSPNEESPLLLLFLDCVWQLLQQYPEEFEFSETYLTTIWDSAFMPIFDTFQFNCEHDRHVAVMEKKLILRPVWDWGAQFDKKDQHFFLNPLYLTKSHITKNVIQQQVNPTMFVVFNNNGSNISDVQSPNRSTIPNNRHLEPLCGISDLKVWQQCYFRWLPILEIEHGGYPQIDLLHRLLIQNITKLQRALVSGEFNDLPINKNVRCRNQKTFIIASEIALEDNINLIEKLRTNEQNNSEDDVTANSIFKKTVPRSKVRANYPIVDSFFPFSLYKDNSSESSDILMHCNEPSLDDVIIN